MCGISVSDKAGLAQRVRHRGTRLIETPFEGRWLGHAWLPVQTDPSEDMPQPVPLHGRLEGAMLLYNGEIYNYNSLPGETRKWRNDTDYLAAALSENGTDEVFRCLSGAWDGMWAVCVVGPRGLTMWTDPLGKKQLYYDARGRVCSEASALADDPWDIDPLWRSMARKWGYAATTRTPWRGVTQAPPGAKVTIVKGMEARPFVEPPSWRWAGVLPGGTPSALLAGATPAEAAQAVRKAVRDSVRARTLSSKGSHTIGVFLSGGLDSAATASCLKGAGARLRLFSLKGLDPADEEGAMACAEALGLPVEWVGTAPLDTPEWQEDALYWNGSPVDLGSVGAQHLLCGAAAAQGIDVVLTGDGADELFGGYRRSQSYDSQLSDVFEELPFYHLPRLDRASMRFTQELRTPMLGHAVARAALALPREARTGKAVLKEAFREDVPASALTRPKTPLKAAGLKKNPDAWREMCHRMFYGPVLERMARARAEEKETTL